MYMNKRGQGLSTSAIVLIVIAIVVLIVLILGFTMGWEKFLPWLKKENNIETIVQQCSIACSSQSTYEWCQAKKTITGVEGLKDTDAKKTCFELTSFEYGAGTDNAIIKPVPICPEIPICS